MDWNAVADAITDICHTRTGINALEFVPDSLPSEALYVGEIDAEMDVTMRRRSSGTRLGTDKATITLRILVARSTDRHAIRKMREYMGGSGVRSIVDALGSDRTLGGTVHDSQVQRMRGNRLFTVGELRFYGVELDLFVIGDA